MLSLVPDPFHTDRDPHEQDRQEKDRPSQFRSDSRRHADPGHQVRFHLCIDCLHDAGDWEHYSSGCSESAGKQRSIIRQTDWDHDPGTIHQGHQLLPRSDLDGSFRWRSFRMEDGLPGLCRHHLAGHGVVSALPHKGARDQGFRHLFRKDFFPAERQVHSHVLHRHTGPCRGRCRDGSYLPETPPGTLRPSA